MLRWGHRHLCGRFVHPSGSVLCIWALAAWPWGQLQRERACSSRTHPRASLAERQQLKRREWGGRRARQGSGQFPLPQLMGRAGKTFVGVDLLHSCPPESWWGGQAFALRKLKASDLGFTSLPGSLVWECGLIQPIRCSCPELLSQSDASAQNHVANQM